MLPRNLLSAAFLFGVTAVLPASGLPTVQVAAGAEPSTNPSADPSASPPAAPRPIASATPAATPPPTPLHSSLTTLRLPSHDHGRTSRNVVVYRPAAVERTTLPVLYLLHGQYGAPGGIVNADLQHQLDHLFASGVTPFVVAAPDGASTTRSDDEWGDASDNADRLESFVQKQVIPAVEGANRRDRGHRGVAGFSMGGYGAAFTAGLHNDLFGQVVSLAGYFHVDDPQHVFTDPAVRDLHYPLHHLRWLNNSRMLLLDCTNETDPVIAGEAQRMHDALARLGRAPGLHITPGQHDGAWLSRQWPAVGRFLAEGWGR